MKCLKKKHFFVTCTLRGEGYGSLSEICFSTRYVYEVHDWYILNCSITSHNRQHNSNCTTIYGYKWNYSIKYRGILIAIHFKHFFLYNSNKLEKSEFSAITTSIRFFVRFFSVWAFHSFFIVIIWKFKGSWQTYLNFISSKTIQNEKNKLLNFHISVKYSSFFRQFLMFSK